MDTIGIDTYALVAVGVDAVLNVATRHGRMTTVGSAGGQPAIEAFSARRRQANDGRNPAYARAFAAR